VAEPTEGREREWPVEVFLLPRLPSILYINIKEYTITALR